MSYAQHVSSRKTSQSQAIFGREQVKNNAGGFVFATDIWTRLERFLILGCEGGSYYVGERPMTVDNAKVVLECAAVDSSRTVKTIAGISSAGRAPKNDAAIFALALVASHGDNVARSHALHHLSTVCRIPTHLFQFIGACKEMRGWGRGLRNAVATWYDVMPIERLAYQVTKYRNREGYTHRDALRLSHPRTNSDVRNALYKYLTQGGSIPCIPANSPLAIVEGFEAIQKLGPGDERKAADLIRKYQMSFEHVPNTLLNSTVIWEELLPHMPPTALIRNLGKLSSIGLLKPLSAATNLVCRHLMNMEDLKRARVHPLSILLAQDTYRQGHGFRGALTWTPVTQITAALEDAFYASFDAVEPTGKRHMVALDVSGSMGSQRVANTNLSARDVSACMSMVTTKTEPQTLVTAFSGGISPMDINRCSRLSEVIALIKSIRMSRTDCALPMLYAAENKIEVDAFIIYTDNETWSGDIHPCQALTQYRQKMGINAKLIVAGTTATGFTIADPNDAGMLDVVGFDAACPAVMADFVRN